MNMLRFHPPPKTPLHPHQNSASHLCPSHLLVQECTGVDPCCAGPRLRQLTEPLDCCQACGLVTLAQAIQDHTVARLGQVRPGRQQLHVGAVHCGVSVPVRQQQEQQHGRDRTTPHKVEMPTCGTCCWFWRNQGATGSAWCPVTKPCHILCNQTQHPVVKVANQSNSTQAHCRGAGVCTPYKNMLWTIAGPNLMLVQCSARRASATLSQHTLC
jgi:hypothetical protein